MLVCYQWQGAAECHEPAAVAAWSLDVVYGVVSGYGCIVVKKSFNVDTTDRNGKHYVIIDK